MQRRQTAVRRRLPRAAPGRRGAASCALEDVAVPRAILWRLFLDQALIAVRDVHDGADARVVSAEMNDHRARLDGALDGKLVRLLGVADACRQQPIEKNGKRVQVAGV